MDIMRPGIRSLAIFLSVLLCAVCLSVPCYGDDPPSPSEIVQPSRGVWKDADPVWTSSRRFFISENVASLGGPLPVSYSIYYPAPYASSRVMEYTPQIVYTSGYYAFVEFFGEDKGAFSMTKSGSTWAGTSNASRGYNIRETDWYFYIRDPVDELVYVFLKASGGTANQMAYLYYVLDRKGNTLTYTDLENAYEKGDGLGRTLHISYSSTEPRGYTITDQAGRSWFRGEGGTGTTEHFTIVDALGNATKYYWGLNWSDGTDIRKIEKPLGNAIVTNTFEASTCEDVDCGLVTTQTDAYGNVTTFSTGTGVTVTAPDGATTNYQFYGGAPSSITDTTGKTATFGTTARGLISSITDRMGGVTSITYHDSGKIASVTNARGNTVTNTYTAQNQTFTNPVNSEHVTFPFYNLTRIDYPDGMNEQFTYDASGNMLTRVDQAGNTWTYTYNGRGLPLTKTNPAGGVTTYTYNADATLASAADPDGIVTTYAYDAYKRLHRVTHGDATYMEIGYDLADNVTSVRDENGNTYAYTYDANGNLTKVTDPLGHETAYAYDLMERVVRITNRLGKSTAMAYNTMGRLQSVIDPNGLASSLGYDARGRQNSVTLGGKTWEAGHNDEGGVTSVKTPLANTTAYQNDAIGLVAAFTDPLSKTTTLTRDSMTRLTGVTDPLGRTVSYTYDGRGLLSSATMPEVGTATYARNNLGKLSSITDLLGSAWGFSYTPAGRLASFTDPLGNIRTNTYDALGRLSTVAFPTGDTLTRTYDGAGNVTRLLYSGGPDLEYTYDGPGRLLTTESLALTRDAEGRVTSTENPGDAFGATYDDGGRLASASYNNNAFTVTYTYDATTGLLAGVEDSLTGAYVDFTYDNDRNLIAMARSNGVNAAYTYDKAGRLTRIQDGSIIDLLYTLDSAGQVASLAMTAPLDPATLLTNGTSAFTYDKASRVSTAGYAYDARGRLTASPGHTYTWNGGSRLTALDSVTFAYNGLGDLVTRGTTHYYYNKAIGLGPIVAEKNDASGSYLRYYVWTPSGKLLYMIDAATKKPCFYHFDRTGSTLALTSSTGTVTDSYAYTPYGKLLSHSGSSAQPFTFTGKWGVRQEGSSGSAYQMRARYYDAATARFISREPLWPNLAVPLQLNPYQYALDNPITYVDVTGRDSTDEEYRRYLREQVRVWAPVTEATTPYERSKIEEARNDEIVQEKADAYNEKHANELFWARFHEREKQYEREAVENEYKEVQRKMKEKYELTRRGLVIVGDYLTPRKALDGRKAQKTVSVKVGNRKYAIGSMGGDWKPGDPTGLDMSHELADILMKTLFLRYAPDTD